MLQGNLSLSGIYKENWESGKYTGVSLLFRSDKGLVKHVRKRKSV
jgi:hypothetical protein